MEKVRIYCVNLGRALEVAPGQTLESLAEKLGIKLKYRTIGGIVNGKFVGLSYRVFQPKRIEFFDTHHSEGKRMINRTLVMMLSVAVDETLPGAQLEVLHSVSKGLYCEIRKDGKRLDPTTGEVEGILAHMRKLCKDDLPIERREIPTDEALALLPDKKDTCRLLRQHGELYTAVHTLAGHSAVLYGDLAQRTSDAPVFNLKEYFSGMLLQLPDDNNPDQLAEATLQNKMFATFLQFDKIQDLLGVRRLADLNDAIANGDGKRIIQVSEALHEKQIADIADMIAERRDKVKVVLISGPSSSGKTTFSKRLSVQLMACGVKPHAMSSDDYFVDRDRTPRDEKGDYDFEHINAMDIGRLTSDINALIRGEEVALPRYDFESGKSVDSGKRMKLGEGEVLILEGIHALNPVLTEGVDENCKYRIYASALTSVMLDDHNYIPTTDNRLLRRIVRDYKYRARSAEETIRQWPSVRRGENRWIFPYQEQADVMVNTALLFELAALREQALPLLEQVPENVPEYSEAYRLRKFLMYIKPISTRGLPPTSLLREFLGGSTFKY